MTNAIRIKKIIQIIAFIALLILSVQITTFVLQDKSSINKNRDFFNQKEDFDVLLFGSSHMEIFISPMELWKNYGIVSYNFGEPEEGIPVSYWLMRNAIAIHKPKVIMFDVSMIDRGDEFSNEEHLHYALDSFPISIEKWNAVNDLLTDRNEKIEMFFKIGNYHNRWKDLSKDHLSTSTSFIKGNLSYGVEQTMHVSPFEQCEIMYSASNLQENHRDIIYIKRMIDLCEENDIDLVFVVNPFRCEPSRQEKFNQIEEIANNDGVPFINFIKMDSVTDMSIDMYDIEHVNQSGLHKMTDYYGSYLTNNYELRDHRGEAEYIKWDYDYNSYLKLKYKSMWNIADDDIINVLEMLHDRDVKSYVFVGKDANIDMNMDVVMPLLQNIGRENLDIYGANAIKSKDIITLDKAASCLAYGCDTRDNFLLYNDGLMKSIESTSDEALKTINNMFPELEISSSDIIIIVANTQDNSIKFVRKYNSLGYTIESVYNDIE